MTPERFQRINEIFDAVLDLPPDQRARYLEDACAPDEELHREVQALLAEHYLRQSDSADQPVTSEPDTAAAPIASSPGESPQVNGYRMLGRLGSGGMGAVYLAEHLRLKRQVAIKFCQPDPCPESLRTRFLREARAASTLNHPHIATIYDYGETDEGKAFLVMESVKGDTLRKLLEGGPVPPDRAVKLCLQIAEALKYAHEQGIVHRDIKPSNIGLTESGDVKILDFGLVKLLPAARDRMLPTISRSVDQDLASRAGDILGTPRYMAPEQARGAETDARVDVFALGTVFWECLTGHPAFRGTTTSETLALVQFFDPPPPSQSTSGVPARLDQIARRCMAKQPGDRYETMAELAADLQAVRESGSGVLHPPPERKFLRRRLIYAGTAGLIATASAWLLRDRYLSDQQPLPARKSVAVLKFENIDKDAAQEAFCQGLMEVLASKLTQLERFQGALLVVPASDVRREDIQTVRAAQRAFGVNLALTGSVQRTPEGIRLTANVVDAKEVRQLRSRQVSLPQTEPSAMQDGVVREVADLLDLELRPEARATMAQGNTPIPGAHDYYLQGLGYLHTGASGTDQAITLIRHSLELDPKYALAHAALGRAYWRKYLATKEQQWIEPAWQASQRAIELNPRLPQARTTRAALFSGSGRYEEAVAECNLALQADPFDRDASAERAQALERLGRLGEAEEQLRATIRLRPGYWHGYLRLGTFFLRYGRYPEAEEPYKRVIDLVPDNSAGYANLGALYHLEGRESEAEVMLRKSLDLRATQQTYSNLATVYFFQRRFDDAVSILEKLTSAGSKEYVIWGNLGDACRWSSKHTDKAASAYEKALALAEQALAVNRRDPEALSSTAVYYAKLGKSQQSLRAAQKAFSAAPQDKHVLFNISVVYELAGNREKAVQYLGEAIKGGYSRNEIMAEPELEKLRADTRFQQKFRPVVSPVK